LLERTQYKFLEKKVKSKFNIVWNFENSRFYNFNFLQGSVLKIYHQVDLNQNFHPLTAARTADIVFCTTEFIKQSLEVANKPVFKITHGFSGHLATGAKSIIEKNECVIEKISKVKACYIGNLDIPYLHIELLKKLIAENPEVDFYFVGPYSKSGTFFKELSSYKNVVLKGFVKAFEISDYLDRSDILLLIYKSEEFKEQLSNPHKLMEYLASGKIVVATYTDEYKNYRDLLSMADRSEEIPGLFQLAKSRLAEYNSVPAMKDRIRFALDNTYEQQVNRIEHLIKHHVRKVIRQE
jgi:glycosyltransferase involved in cell wall biosynthesis